MNKTDNKKEWNPAQLQIINFTVQDVIATSPEEKGDMNANQGGWDKN